MTKVWLVTGCSSGLGKLLVLAIVARGDRVIATARNVAALKQFEDNPGVRTLQLDVTAEQDIIDAKVHDALGKFGQIDVLVNNAGFVGSGVWEEVSHKDALRQFETNFFGAMNMTRSVLPLFRSRKSGTLLFVSSIAAWLGVGAGGLYSSSKFALEGAVESLHDEVKHLNINTHLLVLGQFRTEILSADRGLARRSENPIPEYDAIFDALLQRQIATDGKQPGDPQLAVQRIVDVVRREGVLHNVENLPLRIPLGSDAVEIMRRKCEETMRLLDDLALFAKSTDFADVHAVPSYR
ncbi:hypothetical protein LTR84_004728 [Exophiala bonariae]|uniref:Uncharacterized protein n=1 Tax=Exophiala bonariae TaxID=1690606 RepID=A0AAV9NRS9_9EURO|nr:hypothetical protein LTR84_004728 [Exophiala bonariae]